MAERNHSMVTEFFLSGLTEIPEMKVFCFLLFLTMYLITVMGNIGMVLLITVDPQLHTPMYFFLSHLAFVDFCYSSSITPKTLVNFLAERRAISFGACVTQLFIFVLTASAECLLLAVMAYDRYVAICNSLLYTVIMSPKLCAHLVAGSYLIGFVHALAQSISTFTLSFCSSIVINHYFCDIPPLIQLSCSNTYRNELVLYIFGTFHGIFTSLEILVSYIYILSTILRIRSTEGRHKAFSTCASHLTAVMLFYGTTVFMYVRPISSYSLDRDKVVSVFYTMVIPMLNPLIYSLRNKEVKGALKRLLRRIKLS
ncbi:olfactory receptor 1038-like [Alligator sinensis]|uniref:Olfactory receptor n=1 Tax=Alligator sinensis TaxID=38654 RepID=A0A1U7SQJ3_ALLSI|nr:olfactory receptor 1038-like [Alligator sinensis]